MTTKRTLAALSFEIERIARDAGPDTTVIAMFQRDAYFAPMLPTYTALAASCLTVVVGFAGDGVTPPDVIRVQLADEDALADEWSVVVLSPSVAAYVVARDMDELDVTGRTMEHRRRFRALWGFDRAGAADHARRILTDMRERMPADIADRVQSAIVLAGEAPATTAEASLGRAALSLAVGLEKSQVRLDDAIARLDRETRHATRDPLTGLANREGLQRWLGGSTLDGVDMPLVGVVMIDLDGFKAINDTYGHAVGDQLLQAVAHTLTRHTRPGDIVTRWGGDEFVVLCPGLEGERLTQVAARMVAAIGETSVGDVRVTASAGTQSCRYRPIPMVAADTAMYAAKRAGGSRVVAIAAPPSERR